MPVFLVVYWLKKILKALTVSLNIPQFVGSRSQHKPSGVIATQEIASGQIHVERAVNKRY